MNPDPPPLPRPLAAPRPLLQELTAPGSLTRQITAYVGVGLVAAVGHYSVLVALVELLRQDPVLASLAGFVVGGVISYVLNRRYTFKSDRAHEAAVPRFVLVTGIGFVLTWLLMTALTAMGMHYLLAQMATTVAVLGWNFTANRLWTFRPLAG